MSERKLRYAQIDNPKWPNVNAKIVGDLLDQRSVQSTFYPLSLLRYVVHVVITRNATRKEKNVLVNFEKFTNWLMDFLSRLPEKDMYISGQSRRYWLLKEYMDHVRRARVK